MARHAKGRPAAPDPRASHGIRAWPRLAQGAIGLAGVCAISALTLSVLTLRDAPVAAVVTGTLEITPEAGLFDDLRVYDRPLDGPEPAEMAALVRLTEGPDTGQVLVARGVPPEGVRVGDTGVIWPVGGQDATWGATPTVASFLRPLVLGVAALLLAIGAGFGAEWNKPIMGRKR